MKEPAGFNIRYTYVTDTLYLKKWLAAPNMLHWFPMSNQQEVDEAVAVWVGYARFSSSLTATIDGVPCGIATLFLMHYKKVAHHCLFKVIVDPQHQRKGVGSALIKNLKHLAKTYFGLESIHTEIVEGNPLIALLGRFDFHEFARQERYFKEGESGYARVLLESNL